MVWKSNIITGLWSRRIERKTDGATVEYQQVKLDETTIEKLKNLRVGDLLQVWPCDQRKNDNSPTYQIRVSIPPKE